MSNEIDPQQVVKLSVQQLTSNHPDDLLFVFNSIEKAYGPDGIGLLLVTNLTSSFQQDRIDLFSSARCLTKLSSQQIAQLECPEVDYVIGWARGHESFRGKIDYNKGSYYANPIHDDPTLGDTSLYDKYPHYMHPNCWPQMSSCNKLETSFKTLSSYIRQVGILVAKQCDRYVTHCMQDQVQFSTLAQLIEKSRCPRGRLLHYFSSCQGDGSSQSYVTDSDKQPLWCGYHNDVSILTGLVSAAYYQNDDDDPLEAPPDSISGLYIKTDAQTSQLITIPKDCIAFQIGECAQILTAGILQATAHAVKSPQTMSNFSRVTFALFLQPDPWDSINIPSLVTSRKLQPLYSSQVVPSLKDRYFANDTFADFATRTFKKYAS